MSNELSSPPIGPAPTTSAPVEFVVKNRSTVAGVLAVLGVVCLGLAIYCFYKAFTNAPVSDEEKEKAAEKLKLTDPEGEVATVIPHQTAYIGGGIIGLMAAVAGIGVAAFAGMGIPQPTRAGQLTDARMLILLSGALFGLVLMTAGLYYFIIWFDSLTLGLDQKKLGELKWVLGPILVFLIGAGLAFLAAQPARADERDNSTVRRIIYGTNFGLTVMLVILALLVGNVLIALKVPNRLDTTESGLHSVTLTKEMKEYLIGLPKTIRVYAILHGEDQTTVDTRLLLEECQKVNPDRFVVRFLSPTLNQKDIHKLRNDYPQVEIEQTGVLFVLEDNSKVASYVRRSEFEKRDPRSPRRDTEFVGQARVAQEILFMTETSSEAVVYVTHTSRELELVRPEDAGPEAAPKGRSANELRTALEGIRCRLLRLPSEQPGVEYKIPDDADIVVVADPLSPLPGKVEDAIRKFLSNPRPNGKPKGKLIVLAGANPQAGSRALAATGLEDLLGEYGVQLPPAVIYAQPTNEIPTAKALIAMLNPNLLAERNTIAVTFERRGFVLFDCRAVRSGQAPQPGIQTQPLLYSTADRITWMEPEILANPEKAFDDIFRNQNPDLNRKKSFGRANRQLGAIVSEATEDKTVGRIVVIGCGTFADEQVHSDSLELIVASVNWLRDRKALANIPAKPINYYTAPKSVNEVRLFWFPVALVIGGVAALGLGVWVLRRK